MNFSFKHLVSICSDRLANVINYMKSLRLKFCFKNYKIFGWDMGLRQLYFSLDTNVSTKDDPTKIQINWGILVWYICYFSLSVACNFLYIILVGTILKVDFWNSNIEHKNDFLYHLWDTAWYKSVNYLVFLSYVVKRSALSLQYSTKINWVQLVHLNWQWELNNFTYWPSGNL